MNVLDIFNSYILTKLLKLVGYDTVPLIKFIDMIENAFCVV